MKQILTLAVLVIADAGHANDSITVQLPGGASMEMVWIEPGAFSMGAPDGESGRDGEGPQHEVLISKGFYLGKYELTQEQWRSVMGTTPWAGGRIPEGRNYPAVAISHGTTPRLFSSN